ncbi:MAG: fibronectin type III domain-containing protein, partial [Candidatus Cloacimonetes bacterium]|nr:fibronectin type III domain-containing protein [Candidatus Cloacimonadota bacterium]
MTLLYVENEFRTEEIDYTAKLTITHIDTAREEPYVFEINLTGTGFVSPPPPPANLTAPVDGATNVALKPTFTWVRDFPDPILEEQVLRISLSADMTDFIPVTHGAITATMGSTTLTSDLEYNTKYFWRIDRRRGAGAAAVWSYSEVRSFTTETTIEPPIFSIAFAEPDFGDVLVGENHLAPFSITNTSNEPISVYLEFENDYDGVFNIMLSGNIVLPQLMALIPIPAGYTLSFEILFSPAEVQSYNTNFIITHFIDGALGDFSIEIPITGAGYMATTPPPGQVTLVSPTNGATGQPLRPTLSWQQPEGTVTGYYVYRGTTANPSTNQANLVYTAPNETTLSWTHTTDLEHNTMYHWQVVAINSTGNGEASASWSFTTLSPITNPPQNL